MHLHELISPSKSLVLFVSMSCQKLPFSGSQFSQLLKGERSGLWGACRFQTCYTLRPCGSRNLACLLPYLVLSAWVSHDPEKNVA